MKYIPFHKPSIPASAIEGLKQVIDSGWITTGKKVQRLESSIAKIIGAKYTVAVSSGTAALHLAYLAAGIGRGDEVIVPSYTFCLEPKDGEKRMTRKTKGIVVVNFAGLPANLDEINNLARQHNLVIVEDAAHAFLTKYKGKYVGSGKNLTCFSFYATKNLTTAEGGLVVCPNLETANYVRMMSLHGISKNAWKRYQKTGSCKYDVLFPGLKYNLSDIHAAIGLAQVPLAGKAHVTRVRLAKLYKQLLSHNPNLILPAEPVHPTSEHAWHLFVVRVQPSSRIGRDGLIEKLKSAGIGTSVHFIPNHQQTLYKKLALNRQLPVTEKIFRQILSLPFYENLSEKEVRRVCLTLNQLTYGK